MNRFKYSLDNKRYHTYNYYLKNKYHQKVAKVALNADFTCPNRDGTKGWGGYIPDSFSPAKTVKKGTRKKIKYPPRTMDQPGIKSITEAVRKKTGIKNEEKPKVLNKRVPRENKTPSSPSEKRKTSREIKAKQPAVISTKPKIRQRVL